MNERPTPETDAIWKDYYHGELSWVDLHFAMQDLERELAEAREELEDWRNAAKGAKNPCPDEVHCTCVPLLHKQLKDAREAFAVVADQLVQVQRENRRLRKELVPEVFRTVLVFSARYVHHRNTGGTMAVCNALDLCWQNLDLQTREQILKESHEATCNLQEWEDFRETHQ